MRLRCYVTVIRDRVDVVFFCFFSYLEVFYVKKNIGVVHGCGFDSVLWKYFGIFDGSIRFCENILFIGGITLSTNSKCFKCMEIIIIHCLH